MTPQTAVKEIEHMNAQFVHGPRPFDEIIAALKPLVDQPGEDIDAEWPTEWPTEAGLYWFYGTRFGVGDPKLCFVEAYEANNAIILIGCGHFWYKAENHEGRWQRVRLPKLPTT